MKHQYLVESKVKGLERQGLHTTSCTYEKLENIIGSFLMYKLDKDGSLKTTVIKEGKTWEIHAIKINHQPGIDIWYIIIIYIIYGKKS